MENQSNYTKGLEQQNFVPLALKGLDDGWNSYIHSMAWFEGRLYCGTFRGNLCLKKRQRMHGYTWPVWPIKCPDPNTVFETLDLCAEIWRYDPVDAEWERVQKAPMVIGRHGKLITRECSYRGMAVFQGASDSKPNLYVSTFSNTDSTGALILRSDDGRVFKPTSKPNLGVDGVSSFRFLVKFNGKLYTSPIGSNKNVVNQSTKPVVFESNDPARGEWAEVSRHGFGDAKNIVVFNVAAFNNYLYAGTMNTSEGFQLWKTDALGEPPYDWQCVLSYGAFRGNLNQSVLAMCTFRDSLYVGTAVQDGGYDKTNKVGPAASELIRVNRDDSWDIIVGSSRLTPEGVKIPISGYLPGFNNLFNSYFWRMCVHEEHLYLGTVNWSCFLPYLNKNSWPDTFRELVKGFKIEQALDKKGGCDLWRSRDGCEWEPVVTNGFFNRYNTGIRSLVSTPLGLAVGTVNPFGPEVAVRQSGDDMWEYVSNPRGGCEVWLGSKSFSDRILDSFPLGGSSNNPATCRDLVLPVFSSPISRVVKHEPVDEEVESFSFDRNTLLAMGKKIDARSIDAEMIMQLRDYYEMTEEGIEHVPKTGPALLICNNPVVPLFIGNALVALHTVLTLDVLAKLRQNAVRLMVPLKQYRLLRNFESFLKTIEKLGYVPDCNGHAEQLLEMKEAIMIYPEGQPSVPAYQTRQFSHEFVKIAWNKKVPVIPMIFIGPHESHFMIEKEAVQVRVNKRQILRVPYKLKFMHAIDVRTALSQIDDERLVAKFCNEIYQSMQEELNKEQENRPMINIAKRLQSKYG